MEPIIREAKPGEEVCDFCSSPKPKWKFRARPHVQGAIVALDLLAPSESRTYTMSSADDWWAACEACKALIKAGRRDQLHRRSVTRLRRTPHGARVSKEMAERMIRVAHDKFWSNREGGEAVPIHSELES